MSYVNSAGEIIQGSPGSSPSSWTPSSLSKMFWDLVEFVILFDLVHGLFNLLADIITDWVREHGSTQTVLQVGLESMAQHGFRTMVSPDLTNRGSKYQSDYRAGSSGRGGGGGPPPGPPRRRLGRIGGGSGVSSPPMAGGG